MLEITTINMTATDLNILLDILYILVELFYRKLQLELKLKKKTKIYFFI